MNTSKKQAYTKTGFLGCNSLLFWYNIESETEVIA